MTPCLCCGNGLLRHTRLTGLYWYCPNCRQEMPETSSQRQPPHGLSTFSLTCHAQRDRP